MAAEVAFFSTGNIIKGKWKMLWSFGRPLGAAVLVRDICTDKTFVIKAENKDGNRLKIHVAVLKKLQS
jgi:hypothetical protein